MAATCTGCGAPVTASSHPQRGGGNACPSCCPCGGDQPGTIVERAEQLVTAPTFETAMAEVEAAGAGIAAMRIAAERYL